MKDDPRVNFDGKQISSQSMNNQKSFFLPTFAIIIKINKNRYYYKNSLHVIIIEMIVLKYDYIII